MVKMCMIKINFQTWLVIKLLNQKTIFNHTLFLLKLTWYVNLSNGLKENQPIKNV